MTIAFSVVGHAVFIILFIITVELTFTHRYFIFLQLLLASISFITPYYIIVWFLLLMLEIILNSWNYAFIFASTHYFHFYATIMVMPEFTYIILATQGFSYHS